MTRGAAVSWFLALTFLSACGADSAENWYAKWGGRYNVYVHVFAQTDCSNLEAAIVAEVARMGEVRKAEEALASASIIQATYRRMVDLSCAEAFQRADRP